MNQPTFEKSVEIQTAGPSRKGCCGCPLCSCAGCGLVLLVIALLGWGVIAYVRSKVDPVIDKTAACTKMPAPLTRLEKKLVIGKLENALKSLPGADTLRELELRPEEIESMAGSLKRTGKIPGLTGLLLSASKKRVSLRTSVRFDAGKKLFSRLVLGEGERYLNISYEGPFNFRNGTLTYEAGDKKQKTNLTQWIHLASLLSSRELRVPAAEVAADVRNGKVIFRLSKPVLEKLLKELEKSPSQEPPQQKKPTPEVPIFPNPRGI